MVFRYFEKTDMLYIELMPGVSTESQEVAPGMVIDFDAQDRVIGIEVEDASAIVDLSELRVMALPIVNLVVSDRVSTRVVMPEARQSRDFVLAESRESYSVPDIEPGNESANRIASEPAVMVGKPVIKGTRLSVEDILNLLASGASVDEIVAEYDGLSKQDIRACLRFAAQSLRATG